MKIHPPLFPHRRIRVRSGMILLEMLMAIAIFGMVALGLMRALMIGAQTAIIAQMELRMIQKMQSTLTEYSKVQTLQEGAFDIPATDIDMGVVMRVQVEKMDKLLNADGQPLNDMYHIMVTAEYENFGTKGQMTADTYRYANLYKTQAGAVTTN
ncbi:MAG: type II secretion system protein [Verrucomicrobiaceae bacterium]|nr:MAG: type II secretion system protein [Verrucomicrobiaceae bacterium]